MQWGEEQAKAFGALKTFIENLAVMTSPSEKAELLLYIASSVPRSVQLSSKRDQSKVNLSKFPSISSPKP